MVHPVYSFEFLNITERQDVFTKRNLHTIPFPASIYAPAPYSRIHKLLDIRLVRITRKTSRQPRKEVGQQTK